MFNIPSILPFSHFFPDIPWMFRGVLHLGLTENQLPSGKRTQLLKMTIEIVDFPIKHGDFHSYVSLPEDDHRNS